jgi:hypothetical protein
VTKEYIGIRTEIIISSKIDIDHDLRSAEKVAAIAKYLGADNYINPIGGVELYDRVWFGMQGIDLKFLKSKPIYYKQYKTHFIPWLSIIDVMMFNSPNQITDYLLEYTLV